MSGFLLKGCVIKICVKILIGKSQGLGIDFPALFFFCFSQQKVRSIKSRRSMYFKMLTWIQNQHGSIGLNSSSPWLRSQSSVLENFHWALSWFPLFLNREWFSWETPHIKLKKKIKYKNIKTNQILRKTRTPSNLPHSEVRAGQEGWTRVEKKAEF